MMAAVATLATVFSSMAGFPVLAAGIMKETGNTRDRRYCEVFVVKEKVLEVEVKIFNTLGLNDCPGSSWQAMDSAALARQLDAKAIVLNGPRHFLMDWIQSADVDLESEPVQLGGLAMRYVARMAIPITAAASERQPYTPHKIQRTTNWIYAEGSQVYELVGPDSQYFVMQSYAQIVDPDLSMDQLATLGQRLKLPEGWRYRVRTLKQDLEMKTAGEATIVQDELQNTYQLFTFRLQGS
jgi:hypothetical protein